MANLITLARFPVLLAVVLLLYTPNPLGRLLCVPLLVVLMGLDTVDGLVARARHETSLTGSVLDIMVDHASELVLWICYADLRLIPVAIPLIFAVRETVVDALRGLMVRAGTPPLKGMRSKVGGWLVGSPVMRTSLNSTRLLAFAGLALAHALAAYAQAGRGGVESSTVSLVLAIANAITWLCAALSLLRGTPVILEAWLGAR